MITIQPSRSIQQYECIHIYIYAYIYICIYIYVYIYRIYTVELLTLAHVEISVFTNREITITSGLTCLTGRSTIRDVSTCQQVRFVAPSVWPLFGKMMIIHGICLVSHISVFLTSTPSDRRIKSKCVSATVHIDVCGVHSHLTVAVAHLSTTWDNIEVISLPQNPYLVDEQIPFWVESSSLSVQCVKFSSVYQGHSQLRSEALSVMSTR